ncbi:M14 family zinc carboxypeptidase [Acinetobacter rudis]|uniref:M14 family zinc carboxypeptidase n=1 Tax=Acinetobacter rudis TaxID=632955 RepID=UPI0033417B5E
MSVPNQIPIVTYTANGITSKFPITFDLHDQAYLAVTVNKEKPAKGAYSVDGGEVVFRTPPNNGDEVTLARDTVPNRDTNFSSYDNSMRPEVFNYDFDKLWHYLQEQNLVDAISLARIKEEIEWRRTHDFNYDMLAQVREKQIFGALKQYVDTFIGAINPNIFGGVTAGVVFALDQKSVQTHLEEIADQLEQSREDLNSKADAEDTASKLSSKAEKQEIANLDRQKADITYVDEKVASVANNQAGTYATVTEALDYSAGWRPNSTVTITNDGERSGLYRWNGQELIPSEYDPVNQSNKYTNLIASNIIYEASSNAKVERDFYTHIGQSSKVLVNEEMKEVKLAIDRQELDFHTSTNQSGIVIYNEKNQLIQSGDNNEGESLLKENLTALSTSMLETSDDPLFYRNGNTVRQKQRDYPNYYFQSYEELDCTSEGMYQKFDAIMADFPDLITRREIGRSVQDRPIYEYSITPVAWRTGAANPPDDKHIKPITIGIYACIHGDEYAATTGLYIWTQNLMHRWQELDDYGLHRYACQFKIIPCANPDGMTAKTNNNANNVNLNRNFNSDWDSTKVDSGPSAVSEPETKAMQAWFAETDAAMFIDLHEGSQNELMWIGSYTDTGFGILNEVASKMTLFAFQNLDLANYVDPNKTRMVYITKSVGGTAVNYLGNILQKNAILVESPDRTHAMLKRDPQILREYTSKVISTIIESTRTKVQQDRFHGNFKH